MRFEDSHLNTFNEWQRSSVSMHAFNLKVPVHVSFIYKHISNKNKQSRVSQHCRSKVWEIATKGKYYTLKIIISVKINEFASNQVLLIMLITGFKHLSNKEATKGISKASRKVDTSSETIKYIFT